MPVRRDGAGELDVQQNNRRRANRHKSQAREHSSMLSERGGKYLGMYCNAAQTMLRPVQTVQIVQTQYSPALEEPTQHKPKPEQSEAKATKQASKHAQSKWRGRVELFLAQSAPKMPWNSAKICPKTKRVCSG